MTSIYLVVTNCASELRPGTFANALPCDVFDEEGERLASRVSRTGHRDRFFSVARDFHYERLPIVRVINNIVLIKN